MSVEVTRDFWQKENKDWFLGGDRSKGGLTENTHTKCRICHEWIFRGYTRTHECEPNRVQLVERGEL